MSSLLRFAVVLACFLNALTAAAQSGCFHPETPWGCFASVELRSTAQSVETVRLSGYIGGELMAEIEQGGRKTAALIVQPSGLTLYRGTDAPTAGAPTGPFMFFNEKIGWGALLPLHTAYPSGPDSVPNETTEKTIQIDDVQMTIQTTRQTSDRIQFRYGVGDESKGVVEGHWDRQLRARLPDDFSVSDWKHGSSDVISNLRDARSLDRRSRVIQ